VSYTVREENNVLVAEQVSVIDGKTLRMRRMIGVDDSELLAVNASCRGEDAVCTSALRTLALDSKSLRPLSPGGDEPDSSKAYAIGYGAGRVAGILIGMGALLWFAIYLLRQRRAR
jgi:hypothetical protein